MRYNEKPVHRRVIVPWYDTDTMCRMVVICLVPVFAFAVVGVHTAGTRGEWHTAIWVPLLLAVMSLFVVIRMVIRLVRRRQEVE